MILLPGIRELVRELAIVDALLGGIRALWMAAAHHGWMAGPSSITVRVLGTL